MTQMQSKNTRQEHRQKFPRNDLALYVDIL